MTKLSVVLAVLNEEDNLDECLKTVKDLADEIVIVDGGSIDETIEIAKRYGAKIIQTDNPPIFHINKNKAIDAATGDWILQLDADERLSSPLSKEIAETISKEDAKDGYWMPRANLFLGRFLKKGGQYPDCTLRLYRKGKGRLPAKDVHEQAEVKGQVGFLKHDLLHLRDKDFAHYLDGLNRYTDLIAMQLKESKTKRNLLSILNFLLIKPLWWFGKTYFRHRGYLDGFPGFVFSLFSALRFPVSYIKFWINYENRP